MVNFEGCCSDSTEKTLRLNSYRRGRECVYILKQGETVVYVGMTNRPHLRFASHRTDKNFTVMEIVQTYTDRAEASKSEIELIKLYRPKYNYSHNRVS